MIFSRKELPMYNKVYRGGEPEITVVMPCFNQEAIIANVIEKVVFSVKSGFELLLIDDCSSDDTLLKILEFFENFQVEDSSLLEVRIFRNTKPRYETWCDAFGFRVARGVYLLEIQADMYIDDHGFDLRMIDALNQNLDVFAISGRGTHDFQSVIQTYKLTLGTDRAYSQSFFLFVLRIVLRRVKPKLDKIFSRGQHLQTEFSSHVKTEIDHVSLDKIFPTIDNFRHTHEAGLLGDFIEIGQIDIESNKLSLYLGQTVMRGPLMLKADELKKIGGFDSRAYFQGFDDHDLMLRAFLGFGLRCAYLPVQVRSSLIDGSTRKPRSLKADMQIILNTARIQFWRRSTFLYKASKSSSTLLPTEEIRFLDNKDFKSS